MAAPKCFECARWTVKSGCALEKENYWDFRACTLDERNFMIPRIVRDSFEGIDKEGDTECQKRKA